MIIDDDRGFCKCISNIINKYHLGVIATSCSDGLEAESLIHKCRPDIVIIDLLLPGQSGIELTKKLAVSNSQISCIMISACSNTSIIEQAYLSGVDFYLQKPVNVLEFTTAVSTVIKSKASTGC